MFLSKIQLNPRRLQAQRLLSDRRALHAAVLAGLPEQPVLEPAPGQPRVLWRLDMDQPHQPVVLTVTGTRPDFTHLAEQGGWPGAEVPFAVRDYTRLLDRLAAGQTYRFRLTANPTHSPKLGNPPQDRGKRLAHVTHAQQLGWLTDRVEALGVDLPELAHGGAPDVLVTGRAKVFFRHDKGRVTLGVVTFDGRLQVSDPDRLRTALVSGIGPAKAYGCGLLTLAPIR